MLGKRGRDAGEGDGSGEGSKEKSEQTNPSKRIKVEEESGPGPEAKQAPVTGEWRIKIRIHLVAFQWNLKLSREEAA